MANLMDLVRELKTLNARRKNGEALSAQDEQRRKELKSYLRTTLEAQGGQSMEDSGVRDQPQSSSRSSSGPKEVPTRSSSAPKDVPVRAAAPQPSPVVAAQPIPPPAQKTFKAPPVIEDDPLPVPPQPQPQQAAPKPYVPRKDAYAIQGVGDLIDAAASSEAVAKVNPFAGRKAHASKAEVQEAEERAEAAIRANKKKDRAKNADEAVEQLQGTQAAYTPSEEPFTFEQYYGEFANEGYSSVDASEASHLKPVDPREIELAKLDSTGGPGGGSSSMTVPPGLAFLDDFPALYARRVLPPPDDEVVVDSTDPNMLIPGKRKVTVHLLNGEKKQGAIRSFKRGELGFKLEPIGAGQTEELSISQVKAVFIHTQANASPKEIRGRSLTATFRDGRSVQGASDDYQPGIPVFTLVPPAAGRGQFERIIINGAAVSSVS